MKNLIIVFGILYCVIFSNITIARQLSVQDTLMQVLDDTIVWRVSQMVDLNSGAVGIHECSFIIYGPDKIDWVQSGGEVVYSFDVKSMVTGQEVNDRTLVASYEVNSYMLHGSISIFRRDDQIKITIHFKDGSGGDINNEYLVSTSERF